MAGGRCRTEQGDMRPSIHAVGAMIGRTESAGRARRAGVLTSITVRHGNRMLAGGRGGRSAHPVTAGVTGRRVAVQYTGQRLAAGTVPGRDRWAASGRGRAGQLGLPEMTAPARSWGFFL